MRNAAIAQEGTPRELFEAPADAFVADFIGEANLIPCQINQVVGEMADISIGDYQYNLPARGMSPGSATVAVRPSRVQLLPTGSPDMIAACIAKSTYVGGHMEYSVDTPFGPLFAVSGDVDNPYEVGQELALSFSGSGPVLLPEI